MAAANKNEPPGLSRRGQPAGSLDAENTLVPRSAWIWPLRVPESIGERTLRAALALADGMGPPRRWALAGVLIGAGPLLVDWAAGWPGSRLVTALLLTPLLVAAVARDAFGRGTLLLATAVLAHSALAIVLTASDSDVVASLRVEDEDYWTRSLRWIRTGQSREYYVGWWLPAHGLILVLVVGFTYLSLGLVTLWRGLAEVDLMNYYVGMLAASSHDPWAAVLVGWHPWSVCRGLGYLFLTFEVTSLSLERMCGVPLSTPTRRRRRWLAGLAFLVLDAALKYFLLEATRGVLKANLRAGGE